MSPAELKAVDDRRLCRGAPAADSQAVRDERGARDLSDCSEAAQYCHAKGYVSGTEPYLQCRQTQAAQDASKLLRVILLMSHGPPSWVKP